MKMKFDDWYKELKRIGAEYGYSEEVIDVCKNDWKVCCFDNDLSPEDAILEDLETW